MYKRQIKYQGFVAPGDTLTVEAIITKQEGDAFTLKVSGTVSGRTAVTGRLVLERVEIGETHPVASAFDPYVREELRRQWSLLRPPSVA